MQVATLFREATSLLDAGMEEGSHLKMGGYQDNNVMKTENVHDDGYETAGGADMEISKHPHQHHRQPHHHHHNHNMELASNLPTHVKEEPMMKYDMADDPYSFVDDDHMIAPVPCSPMMHQLPKKRGRKKKIKSEDISMHNSMGYQGIMNCLPSHMKEPGMKMVKERKKHDRFNGMPEEEVSKRTLPDHLTQNLDIVIIGINPGLFAAYKGHHYAGPGNHFWKCLYLSGLTPEPMTADDDYKLLKAGIGFTNMVERATKGSADLTRKEIKEVELPPSYMERLLHIQCFGDSSKVVPLIRGCPSMPSTTAFGIASCYPQLDPDRRQYSKKKVWPNCNFGALSLGSQVLLEKLRKFKPKIAVFNGKLIFEVFSGKKDFSFGRQPELIDGTNTHMWVMPSSSARCAQLPRAADKVPFYAALKKFRDYLNGVVSEIDEKEMVFSYSKLKNFLEPDIKEEVQDSMCHYDGEKEGTLVSENDVKKDDDMSQPKKKRGRPKKIKVEGEQKCDDPPPKQKVEDELGLPKKKRGRPKKVKADSSETSVPQTQSEHSNPPSHCFSPPIQSPSMQSFSLYHQSLYNQRSRSPLPTSYHQSPLQSHGYNQSPQPPSFTHSDLSSEISAAISSEHNPESPALGPPNFEPPANMSEEVSNKSSEEKDEECHFSSPQSKKSYQNYDDFSTDSDSGVRYTQKQMTQDVTTKSLSGLESLVDQIPNITDGEPSHNGGVNGDNEPIGSQYSEDSAYMSDYARSHYSPQYSATTTNSYMQQHSNFSVTSLANSSASDSTFSVSSLAGNYQQPTYPNLMGPPMTSVMDSNAPLFSNSLDRACRIDSNINMPGNATLQYPYPQYSAPYPNPSSGFYPTSHNIHMPSPNYPYPSPYTSTSYHQPSYLPNHMFDRMKTDRMDFGGF